jgi:5-methylcytosine-specific restriction endonuclease McrA
MTSYVPVALRKEVVERAGYCCEYCLLSIDVVIANLEVEHIVAEKHGGRTESSNLALACVRCNRHKGTDVGSFDPETGLLTPFFHPRQHSGLTTLA